MPCLAEAVAALLASKWIRWAKMWLWQFTWYHHPKEIFAWGRICKGVDDAEVEQTSNAIRSWKTYIVGQFQLGESHSKTPYFQWGSADWGCDNSLVENGKQQELDIDDDEWFWLIWIMIVLMKRRLLKFNISAGWASFLS
jgi:hypothetical protein